MSLRLGPRMPIPIYHSRYERSRVPILRLATTDEWPQEKTSIQENDKFTIDYAGKVVKIKMVVGCKHESCKFFNFNI
mgnify:CR=1 FL=1